MSEPIVSGPAGRTITGFPPGTVLLADEKARDLLGYSGMMLEGDRLWTLGSEATLVFALPSIPDRDVLIRFDVAPFVWGERSYTPRTLLAAFESALAPDPCRARRLAGNDAHARYDPPTERHPGGCHEIEPVPPKIVPPGWGWMTDIGREPVSP